MWLNAAETETPNFAHLQLQRKILNSASYKLLNCGFRNISSVNVKACSLSLKLVQCYIANRRTFKMAIIFINNASKMKPFYISKEMTRGKLHCAMNY